MNESVCVCARSMNYKKKKFALCDVPGKCLHLITPDCPCFHNIRTKCANLCAIPLSGLKIQCLNIIVIGK